MDIHDPQTQAASAVVAWGGVGFSKWLEFLGIHAWSDVAAVLASVYSLFLIFDWLHKKWKARK